MKSHKSNVIKLNDRIINYRLNRSKNAKKLRVRVGIDGVDVVKPHGRNSEEIEDFLKRNQDWLLNQVERVERLKAIRKPALEQSCEILFRGAKTPILIEDVASRKKTNKVIFQNSKLTILRGMYAHTPPLKSLENWLRKQAKKEIFQQIDILSKRTGKYPNKIYVMGQRTKWGNCSRLQNLSFNWRLIMAPDFVFRYLVTHEFVHLEVPDHSKRFWLTVQSLNPDMDKARQWLVAHSDQLMVNLNHICKIPPLKPNHDS